MSESRKSLFKSESGTTAIMFAIGAAVVVGIAGLGVDASHWYSKQREIQGLSDVIAMSVAKGMTAQSTSATLTTAASTELSRNGYSSAGITVTVNRPPTSGSYTSNNSAIEVILSQPKQRFLSAVYTGNSSITSRSVALSTTGGKVCVLSLNGSVADATYLTGSSTINMANCILAANSNNNSAITLWGNTTLTAASLYTAGGYTVGGSAVATLTNSATTGATAIADPYSSLTIPSYSGCDHNNMSVKKNDPDLNPGVYCNGLSIGANAVITMNPGVYIIDRGTFDVNGNATLNGTGVTIILTSSTGSGYATISVNGGATMTLTAPTSGTYEGILIYQDQRAATGVTNRLNGGSTTNFTGVVYIPNQALEFTGGNTASGSCTQIVANTVTFTGSSGVTSTCTGTGVDDITTPSVLGLRE